jgi:hypothetical protein
VHLSVIADQQDGGLYPSGRHGADLQQDTCRIPHRMRQW